MIFVTSPALVVSYCLPDTFWERTSAETTYEAELEKCKKIGVESYIKQHNSEIIESRKLKKRHFFRGTMPIDIKKFMEYLSITEMTMYPITKVKV